MAEGQYDAVKYGKLTSGIGKTASIFEQREAYTGVWLGSGEFADSALVCRCSSYSASSISRKVTVFYDFVS